MSGKLHHLRVALLVVRPVDREGGLEDRVGVDDHDHADLAGKHEHHAPHLSSLLLRQAVQDEQHRTRHKV
eukprot:2785067-Rhodomonas_salina.1